MQCFPKPRSVPTKAEEERTWLLATNDLAKEACSEFHFSEKGAVVSVGAICHLPLKSQCTR